MLTELGVGALSTVSAFNRERVRTFSYVQNVAASTHASETSHHIHIAGVTSTVILFFMLIVKFEIQVEGKGQVRDSGILLLTMSSFSLPSTTRWQGTKLVQGWALIQVNFDPIQEVEPAKSGGCAHSFEGGCSFARLRYVYIGTDCKPDRSINRLPGRPVCHPVGLPSINMWKVKIF